MCFFKVCVYRNSCFFMIARIFIWFVNICCSYLYRLSQSIRKIKLLFCYGRRRNYFGRSKQLLMRCFIQDLSLNVHSYLDLFLHGCSSSFDNKWWYQQYYHELLGQISASFIRSIKACRNLNGRWWLIKWTEETLKRKECLLILFLKYGR